MNCPVCQKIMQKNDVLHDCENCGLRLPFTYRGRRISEAEFGELSRNKKTDWRGGWTRKDTAGTLDGRLVLTENKLSFEAKTLAAKCPVCKGEIYKNGKKWSCSGCDFSVAQTLYGRKMSEDELQKLLYFGYTDVFDDFVSSRGKYYRGQIILGECFTLRMEFL